MTSDATRTVIADDDALLVRGIAAGNQAAFEQLMRRFNRQLYRLARAALGDATEAQDALQDAYLLAYRSMGQYRAEAALSTWLSRIVLNECLARIRRSRRRENVVPIVSSNDHIEIEAVAAEDSERPDRKINRAQVRELLERKVDELPEVFRMVFVLRAVEELSVEVTAQVLAVPEATVRSRYFRARSLLRESLAKDVDLAERDIFDFGGSHCDAMIASVLARLTRA